MFKVLCILHAKEKIFPGYSKMQQLTCSKTSTFDKTIYENKCQKTFLMNFQIFFGIFGKFLGYPLAEFHKRLCNFYSFLGDHTDELHNLILKYSKSISKKILYTHRRRIKTEEKANILAAVQGGRICSVPCRASNFAYIERF